MEDNGQNFMNQPSIMSADFDDNSVDWLLKLKTKKRQIRKEKVIKAYKYYDSYLLVKKEKFLVLRTAKKEENSIFNINSFIEKNSKSTIVKEKKDSLKQTVQIITKPKKEISHKKKAIKQHTSIQESPTILAKPSLSSELWLIGILLISLMLFAVIKVQFSNKLKNYTKALLSYHFFNKMFKEQNIVNHRLAISLSFLFYINASLLIYYAIISIAKNPNFSFSYYLSILAVLYLSIIVFTIINKLLGFVFETSKILNEYLYSLYYFHRVLGISLLPIVILYPYLPPIIAQPIMYLAWVIVVFSFIFRWFRGLKISFKNRVSFLYMILYLCTLEIIPLMFIIKMILGLY